MKRNILNNKIPKYENGEFFFDEEKYTYSMFFRQYIWIHIVLVGLLALSVFFSIAVYSNWFQKCENLCSADCWNSIISYTISYFGATFLGLIVFFNTRQRQHLDDRESNLKVYFTACPYSFAPLEFYIAENLETVKFKCWGGSNSENKTLVYIKFNVINYNYKFPMFVEFYGAYYSDENANILKTNDYGFYRTTDKSMPLDYKEESDIYVGVDEGIFKRLPQSIAYVFKCKNVKDIEKYYAYFVTFSEKACSIVIKSFSEKEYNNSLLKDNQPFGIWKFYLIRGKEPKNNFKV